MTVPVPPHGGWRNAATQAASVALQTDPCLLMEAMDRINSLAAGLTLNELLHQAGHEAAAVYYDRDLTPVRDDSIDWQQIAEDLLQRTLRRSLGREL